MSAKLFENLENLLPSERDHLYYVPDFINPENSERYFGLLRREIEWVQGTIKIFGREIREPRLTAWYGDPNASYTYSGSKRTPKQWQSNLLELKEHVEKFCDCRFNSVLLNYYRNGEDSMGWHRDNEKELGIDPIIASLSFGVERSFVIRNYLSKKNKIELMPATGSLIVMLGQIQKHWEHALPKRKKCNAERINLTFRKIQ